MSVSHSSHAVAIAGHAMIADRSGALYWPANKTLLVADLHLEKGSAFASRGRMLPPYDTRETLTRLGSVIASFAPDRVIALGDSLHDPDAAGRIDDDDVQTLTKLQTNRRWLWITGNHDPRIAPSLGGQIADSHLEQGIRFVHEPTGCSLTPELCGHLHPAAKLAAKGTSIRRPCFATDGQRLILPSFGAFTGGLNILDVAFEGLFEPTRLQILMLGRDGIYPVPVAQLVGD